MQRERETPAPAARGEWLPVILLGASLALLLIWCGFWRYTPDDGYIHLTFIKNLARRGAFVFAGDRATYGDTSPLWVLINAVPVVIGAPALIAAKVTGFAAGAAALWAAYALARRAAGPLAGALAGALLATDPWTLRWTVSGLETPLGVAVLLGSALALQARRWYVACFLAGLAPLIRPDFVPFTGLMGIALALEGVQQRSAGSTRVPRWGPMALLLLPGLIWAIYAYGAFGTVIPNTVRVKTLLYKHPLQTWLRALAPILASSHAIVLLAVAATWAFRGRLAWRWPDAAVRLVMLGWPVLLFGGYMASRSAVASRYFLPATAFLYVTGACMLAAASKRWARNVVVASGFLSLAMVAWRVKPEINTYTRNFSAAQTIPAWLNLHASPGDVVAAGDIGYLGYYNEVGYDILDLAGLVSPEMIVPPEARMARTRALRPRFAVERDSVENAVAADRGLQMTALDAAETRRVARFRVAAYLGSPAMQRPRDREWYSLYELNWDLLGSGAKRESSLAGARTPD